MQANILTFVSFDVDSNFFARLQLVSIQQLESLQISPDDVVGLAGRHPLCELPLMVGIKLPFGFFLICEPDLHVDAINRAVVRSPDRPKNQGVGLSRILARMRPARKEHADKSEYRKKIAGNGTAERTRIHWAVARDHRLRFPRLPLRLPRLPLRRRVSTQSG